MYTLHYFYLKVNKILIKLRDVATTYKCTPGPGFSHRLSTIVNSNAKAVVGS